jgi:hypothetical protein
MAVIDFRHVIVRLLLAVPLLGTGGCDSTSGGNTDMDAMVAEMDQAEQRATQAAADAAARQAADEKARAEAEAARLANEQAAAAEAAANAAPQPPNAENETTITITVKNPQGLVNNPEAKAEAERLTAGATSVGQGGSYADAIIGANRSIRNRADDLAWTQAVRSFWAEKGSYPKSHEEFMTGVIEAYGIPLEPLEEGQEYFYAPPGTELSEGEFGTLYIVEQRPQSPPAPAPAE